MVQPHQLSSVRYLVSVWWHWLSTNYYIWYLLSLFKQIHPFEQTLTLSQYEFILLVEGHRRRKWEPAPIFLPRESQDRGAWWATVHGVTKSWTRLSNWTTANSLSHPDKTKSATDSNLIICEMALSQNCLADLRKMYLLWQKRENYSKITDIVVQDSSGRTRVSCYASYTVSEWLIQRKFRWWSLLEWHNIH